MPKIPNYCNNYDREIENRGSLGPANAGTTSRTEGSNWGTYWQNG